MAIPRLISPWGHLRSWEGKINWRIPMCKKCFQWLQSNESPHHSRIAESYARSKLSSHGLNPNPAINCHSSVSQAGWFISVCAVPQMDVKLGVTSFGISPLPSLSLSLSPHPSPFRRFSLICMGPDEIFHWLVPPKEANSSLVFWNGLYLSRIFWYDNHPRVTASSQLLALQ